jgi:hypothetical protein
MSRASIAPTESRRAIKGNGSVVAIGVGRCSVGGDNSARWRLSAYPSDSKIALLKDVLEPEFPYARLTWLETGIRSLQNGV